MSDSKKISVHVGSGLLWLVIWLLLITNNSQSCVSGGGVTVTIDGTRHTFAWRGVNQQGK